MPRSIRACRIVGNARKGPSSVRWVTFAIIAAHISRADNVLRNDNFLFPLIFGYFGVKLLLDDWRQCQS